MPAFFSRSLSAAAEGGGEGRGREGLTDPLIPVEVRVQESVTPELHTACFDVLVLHATIPHHTIHAA